MSTLIIGLIGGALTLALYFVLRWAFPRQADKLYSEFTEELQKHGASAEDLRAALKNVKKAADIAAILRR